MLTVSVDDISSVAGAHADRADCNTTYSDDDLGPG